jgi:serine phosphatase RsbU (regulator of sigma subunit)
MATTDKKRYQKLNVLLEVTKLMSSEVQLDSLLDLILTKTTEVMEAERGSLFLYDPQEQELWSKIAQGLDGKEMRFSVKLGIAGAVAQGKKLLNIPDVSVDERFNPTYDNMHRFVTRSILCAPLLSNADKLIGVIEVINKKNKPHFDAEDEEFLISYANQAAAALQRAQLVESLLEKERFEESLKQAKEIQMSILPKKFPLLHDKRELLDMHACIRPAYNVGGDLFGGVLIDKEHLCFAIGDVSGKGIPAALFMAMITTAFNVMVDSKKSAAEIVNELNNFIIKHNDAEMFCTFFCGILNLASGRVEYSNAGHNPPYLLHSDGTLSALNLTGGLPLGITRSSHYHFDSFYLGKGDALFLYTDGITEAVDPQFLQYGEARLETKLKECCFASARNLTEEVLNAVTAFSGDAEQSDDITMLVVRYAGP